MCQVKENMSVTTDQVGEIDERRLGGFYVEGQPSCQRRAISRGHLETRLLGGHTTRGQYSKARMQNMELVDWGRASKCENKDVERCLNAEKSL